MGEGRRENRRHFSAAVFVLMGLNYILKFKGMAQGILLALLIVLGVLTLLNLFIR